MIDVKEPTSNFQSLFFHENLLKAKAYSLDPMKGSIKLDQNESPFDWDESLKKEVLENLLKESWNTYPQDYPRELRQLLAEYNKVSIDNVVLSPGSNYHITVILNLFASKVGSDLILTRPSFPLFEGHCIYHNISYRVWSLNENLEYDLNLLPPLKEGSVVFFASPNNPVGNILPQKSLVEILGKNPKCYFVVDEAYWEFLEENNAYLLRDFSNLIIIRTFSKAMSSAGVRLSYVLASSSFCKELSKVTLPFLVNKFTTAAATTALRSKFFMEKMKSQVLFTIEERKRLYAGLKESLALNTKIFVLNSQANFVSLMFETEELLKKCESLLLTEGIVIRNVSSPFLKNTLRISIGKEEGNNKLIACLAENFS
jgi:histidinol-phosphate aminotransferase